MGFSEWKNEPHHVKFSCVRRHRDQGVVQREVGFGLFAGEPYFMQRIWTNASTEMRM